MDQITVKGTKKSPLKDNSIDAMWLLAPIPHGEPIEQRSPSEARSTMTVCRPSSAANQTFLAEYTCARIVCVASVLTRKNRKKVAPNTTSVHAFVEFLRSRFTGGEKHRQQLPKS